MQTVDWRRAIELASRAPSIHNSQPWRFVVIDDIVELWLDRTRSVPAIDPTGRQVIVSCGAAIEHVRLALLDQGRASATELLPDPAAPDLLAVIHAQGAASAGDEDTQMIEAIPHRSTVRAPFDPRPVAAEVLDALTSDSALDGTWLRQVKRHEEQVTLAVLLAHAEAAEQSDPAYWHELEHWVRPTRAEDGVPEAALHRTTTRHSTVGLREFPRATDSETPGRHAVSPVDEAPLLVILGTPYDGTRDWLNAGRRLARLLLRAAGFGVVASPLGQVIDDAAPRQQLRAQLGLVGWPQMVLRMGYGQAVPLTGRRPVDALISESASRNTSGA